MGIWQHIAESATEDLSVYFEEIAIGNIEELRDPKDRQNLASSLFDLNFCLKPQEETYVDWRLASSSLAEHPPIQMNHNGQAGSGIYFQFPVFLAQSKFTIYVTSMNDLGICQWSNALGICAADTLIFGQMEEMIRSRNRSPQSPQVAQWQIETKDVPKHVQDLPAAPDFIGQVLATFGTSIANTIFYVGAMRVVAESEDISSAITSYWRHSLETLSTIESN